MLISDLALSFLYDLLKASKRHKLFARRIYAVKKMGCNTLFSQYHMI